MPDLPAQLRTLNLKYADQAADEIERLRKELADLEEATTPWRELQDMKKRIDALEPVAFVHGKPDEPWDCLQWFPDEYSSVPLYDLRGIKE